MKKLFNRTLFVLCAVMLLISAVFAWAAAEEAATPTDLIPQEGEIIPEEPGKEPEPEGDGITSVEVVITKTLTVGQSWEGKMKKSSPVILELAVDKPGSVYMLIEGKDVQASVQKSDRVTDNPPCVQTDPESERVVVNWKAVEGSYLITLSPVEPNLLAMAKVTFMSEESYQAQVTALAKAEKQPEPEPKAEPEPEPESGAEQETETEADSETEAKPELEAETEEESESEAEPEKEPETVSETETDTEPVTEAEPETDEGTEADSIKDPVITLPENFDISYYVTWDTEEPVFGDTAHFISVVNGCEGMNYQIQWQYSEDDKNWVSIPEATNATMDVIATEENYLYYWRFTIHFLPAK